MLVLPALVLAAAAATAAPAPKPLPTLAPALVKLAMPSYTAKQTAIRVKVNQPFQLRLSVTSGTGYTWQPQGPLPPGVTLLGVFSRASSKMVPGGPGEEVLVFRAHDVGTVHLVMEYVRPWEHRTKPAKLAAFSVTVHN
ncbi:MAG TPA: protease inhibitor I42 family protein [Candidatus Baltobacteraceae bacterium]|nr:protease inhibitor I42 family protein [Candidatus Baltobacteraceae bacterium]